MLPGGQALRAKRANGHRCRPYVIVVPVAVTLGLFDAAMAKHRFDLLNLGPGLKRPAGEGVAKVMPSQVLAQAL